MARTVSLSAQQPRPSSFKATDRLALQAIAQAAVDVELFTIPLYMTSLYSITGRHEINSAGATLYKGWTWPGAAPTAEPANANEQAFNILFSIFIEEMLHLQMAGNMASAVGVAPTFTSLALQTPNHGWKCYGDHLTVIPNIIDLADTTNEQVAVNIGPLDEDRLRLFLAIEQPEADAIAAILPDRLSKYFPKAPFASWTPAQPLPMFGTIGWMYQCYFDYLHIAYDDGTTLWQEVFDAGSVQQDHFNAKLPQYDFSLKIDSSDPQAALAEMCNMMDAITDQGEGSVLDRPPAGLLQAVEPEYRSDKANLEQIYPSFDAEGAQLPESADANARSDNDGDDHYARFQTLMKLLPQVGTWATAGKAGNWTASDFQAPSWTGDNPNDLPTPADLAEAWNAIAHEGCFEESYATLSKATVGSIAGTTTVLNTYWSDATTPFPGPAMGGTAQRMATIWAALGRPPNLSIGLDGLPENTLGHSCQGIDYQGDGTNDCAQVEVFHSCIGSNNCHAEGGCGFVNKVTGGGSCGHTSIEPGQRVATPLRAEGAPVLCGGPTPTPTPTPVPYSAPGDNKCQGFGGCAVPISASQLYPAPPNGESQAEMEVFDFEPDPDGYNGWKSVQIGCLPYGEGDKVHDVAWRAFEMVMKNRGKTVPDKPKPSTIRLVFPPST